MNNWLSVGLSIFAVLYAAVSLALLDGPFDLFTRWREFVGQRTWIGRGFQCPMCLALYLAVLPALLLSNAARDFVFIWLGIAGAVTFLYKAAWR